MKNNEVNRTFQVGNGKNEGGLDTTVFHAFLNSDLPPGDQSQYRMWQEGLSVVGAGSETGTNVLVVIHFHLLANPHLLARLQAELKDALPDKDAPVQLVVVEKLPYFSKTHL